MKVWKRLKKQYDLPDVEIIDDPGVTTLMYDYLKPYKHVIDKVLAAFPEPVYVFGGPPRDIMRHVLHGEELKRPSDLDLFIDDSAHTISPAELLERSRGAGIGDVKMFSFEVVHYTHVTVEGILYEIFPFSGKFIYLEHDDLNVSLEATLAAIDLNTSAGCFDLKNGRLISCGALDGIRNRQVEIQFMHHYSIVDTLVRAVMHSRKFGYALGPKALRHIKEQYTPERKPEIVAHVRNKHPEMDPSEVLDVLQQFQ